MIVESKSSEMFIQNASKDGSQVGLEVRIRL